MSASKVADVLGPGTFYYGNYWDATAQTEILAALGQIITAAPYLCRVCRAPASHGQSP